MDYKKMKRRPSSPGEILNMEFMIPMSLTQKVLADHISVDIKVINRLINNKTSLTTEMAFKLASAFDTTPEFWLNSQTAVDLYDVHNKIGSSLPGKLLKN